MDLIDVLNRKIVVENDDDDDFEAKQEHREKIIDTITSALSSKAIKVNAEVVDDWMFGGSGGGWDGYDEQLEYLLACGKVFGYDYEDPEIESLVKFFKAMGLTRGDALFVLDQS